MVFPPTCQSLFLAFFGRGRGSWRGAGEGRRMVIVIAAFRRLERGGPRGTLASCPAGPSEVRGWVRGLVRHRLTTPPQRTRMIFLDRPLIGALAHARSAAVLDPRTLARQLTARELGFEVRSDAVLEGMCWLTVGVPRQPNVELALVEPQAGPMLQPQHAAMLRERCLASALGAGVFRSTDRVADDEALRERGVEFMAPPSPGPLRRGGHLEGPRGQLV